MMLRFAIPERADRPLRILCLGAHSDDIEIGCAGTLFQLLSSRPVDLTWIVLSAQGAARSSEARRSFRAFLRHAASGSFMAGEFRDGFFPAVYEELKEWLLQMGRIHDPDIIFTHRIEDRHQDHRTVAELTWNTWRSQVILEYEIPKFEGDLGQPNFFVPLTAGTRRKKTKHLMQHFSSQRSKSWFRPESFDGLMALRGLECRAPSGFAEAFHARKILL